MVHPRWGPSTGTHWTNLQWWVNYLTWHSGDTFLSRETPPRWGPSTALGLGCHGDYLKGGQQVKAYLTWHRRNTWFTKLAFPRWGLSVVLKLGGHWDYLKCGQQVLQNLPGTEENSPWSGWRLFQDEALPWHWGLGGHCDYLKCRQWVVQN